jgi:hypothetical protein
MLAENCRSVSRRQPQHEARRQRREASSKPPLGSFTDGLVSGTSAVGMVPVRRRPTCCRNFLAFKQAHPIGLEGRFIDISKWRYAHPAAVDLCTVGINKRFHFSISRERAPAASAYRAPRRSHVLTELVGFELKAGPTQRKPGDARRVAGLLRLLGAGSPERPGRARAPCGLEGLLEDDERVPTCLGAVSGNPTVRTPRRARSAPPRRSASAGAPALFSTCRRRSSGRPAFVEQRGV